VCCKNIRQWVCVCVRLSKRGSGCWNESDRRERASVTSHPVYERIVVRHSHTIPKKPVSSEPKNGKNKTLSPPASQTLRGRRFVLSGGNFVCPNTWQVGLLSSYMVSTSCVTEYFYFTKIKLKWSHEAFDQWTVCFNCIIFFWFYVFIYIYIYVYIYTSIFFLIFLLPVSHCTVYVKFRVIAAVCSTIARAKFPFVDNKVYVV